MFGDSRIGFLILTEVSMSLTAFMPFGMKDYGIPNIIR